MSVITIVYFHVTDVAGLKVRIAIVCLRSVVSSLFMSEHIIYDLHIDTADIALIFKWRHTNNIVIICFALYTTGDNSLCSVRHAGHACGAPYIARVSGAVSIFDPVVVKDILYIRRP